MLVNIKYHDQHSLTVEEVVRNAQEAFGSHVQVKCTPDSTLPDDYLTFALHQLLTHEQLSLWFARGTDYNTEISKLRAKTLNKVAEIIDQVILENESKVQ